MIFVFELIKRYIEKLKIEDVNNFAIQNNVFLNEQELAFTYAFVKKNWERILANPSDLNLERYKNEFSAENFAKIKQLIKIYYQSIILVIKFWSNTCLLIISISNLYGG